MRVAPACSRSVAVAAASLPVPSCAEAGVTRPRSSLRARPRRQPPRFAFAAEPKPRRPSRWSVQSHLRARGGRAPESRVTPVAPRRRPGPSPPRFRALRFEDACVLLPSASRAARLATRPPVREAFPAAPIPNRQRACPLPKLLSSPPPVSLTPKTVCAPRVPLRAPRACPLPPAWPPPGLLRSAPGREHPSVESRLPPPEP